MCVFPPSFHYNYPNEEPLNSANVNPISIHTECQQCTIVFCSPECRLKKCKIGERTSFHMDSRFTRGGLEHYTSVCHRESHRNYWEKQKLILLKLLLLTPRVMLVQQCVMLHHLFPKQHNTQSPQRSIFLAFCMSLFSYCLGIHDVKFSILQRNPVGQISSAWPVPQAFIGVWFNDVCRLHSRPMLCLMDVSSVRSLHKIICLTVLIPLH